MSLRRRRRSGALKARKLCQKFQRSAATDAFRGDASLALALHKDRRRGKHDRDDETDADAVDNAEAIDQDAAENRRDHDRQSFDHRLNADAHGVPVRAERDADEREGGQRKAGPGKEEKHSRDDRTPMRHEERERVTGDGEKVEDEKGAPMPPAIDQHAAGVGVDRAEQSAERVEKADDENGGAEDLKIFRDETDPEFFASPDHEGGDQQDDEVALEPEELSGASAERYRCFCIRHRR